MITILFICAALSSGTACTSVEFLTPPACLEAKRVWKTNLKDAWITREFCIIKTTGQEYK